MSARRQSSTCRRRGTTARSESARPSAPRPSRSAMRPPAAFRTSAQSAIPAGRMPTSGRAAGYKPTTGSSGFRPS
ncbi:hypothetical protein ETR14_20065 [Sphingosinicella sp. BN140058]|nr:hypothetical protein ETR14_20065 [Sphingosinicella sp. BN140058]